jgi:methionine synthase II (cobalamin-independent)
MRSPVTTPSKKQAQYRRNKPGRDVRGYHACESGIVEIMKQDMTRLADEGVKYIQVDAPRYSYYLDPK